MLPTIGVSILATALYVASEDVDAALAAFKIEAHQPLEERIAAVQALAKLPDAKVAAALLAALEAQDRREKEQRQQLNKIQEQFAPLDKAMLPRDQWDLHDRLEAERKSVSAKLLAEEQVSREIVDALGQMSTEKAVEPLLQTLRKTPSLTVRLRVIASLARIPGDPVKQALLDGLRQKDVRVRIAVLDALGKRRDPATLDRIAESLGDDSWSVRSTAIASLAELGDRRAAALLVPILERETGRLRDDLVRALETLTGQKLGVNPPAWRAWLSDSSSGASDAGKPSPSPSSSSAEHASKTALSYHGVSTSSQRIVFIWDISDSMREDMESDVIGSDGVANRESVRRSRFDVAREELIRAINALDEKGTFNVISFNHLVEPWQPNVVPSTRKSKNDAIEAIQKVQPSGGTNIFDALEMGFGMAGFGLTDRAYAPAFDTVFFLSDGAPSTGRIVETKEILKAILEMNGLRKIVIHTIGMGTLQDRDFLQKLAAQNGGKYVSLK